MRLIILAALALFQCQLVLAQFGFFDQMFGGGHPGHQQQQQRQSSEGIWLAHGESVPCSAYLCPDSLVCAEKPSDCPCPNVQDIKCVVEDADGQMMRMCTRGPEGCDRVERLLKGI